MATETENAAQHAQAVAREAVACGLVDQGNATRAYQEYAGYLQKGVRGTLTQLLLARKLIDQSGFQQLSQRVPAQFMAQLSQSGVQRIPPPNLHNSGFKLRSPMAAPPTNPAAGLPPQPMAIPPRAAPLPQPAALPSHPAAALPPPTPGLPPQPSAPRYDPDEEATISDGQVIPTPDEPSAAEMTMVDMAIPVLRPPGAPEVDDFNPELTGEMAQPVGYVPPMGSAPRDSDLAPIPLPPGGRSSKAGEETAAPVDKALLEAQERAKASKFATKSGRQKAQPEIVATDHEASKTLAAKVETPRSLKGPLALAVVASLCLGFVYFAGGDDERTQSRTARRSRTAAPSDPGDDTDPDVDPDAPVERPTGTPNDLDPEGMTGEVKRPAFITPAPEPGSLPKWLVSPSGGAGSQAGEVPVSLDGVARFDRYQRAVRDAIRRKKFVSAVAAKDEFLTPEVLSDPKIWEGVTKLKAAIQASFQTYKIEQTKAFDRLLAARRYTKAWAMVQGTKTWSLEDSLQRIWRKQFVTERNGYTSAAKKLKGKACRGKLVEAQLQKHLKGWTQGTARVFDNGGIALCYEGASDIFAKDCGVQGIADDGWEIKPLEKNSLTVVHPLPMARVLDVSVELVLNAPPAANAEIVLFAGLTRKRRKRGDLLAFGVANGQIPAQVLFPHTLEHLTKEEATWPAVGVPTRFTLHVSDRGTFKGSLQALQGTLSTKAGTPFRIKGQTRSAGRVGILFREVDVTILSFDIRGVVNTDQILKAGRRGKAPRRNRKGKKPTTKSGDPKKSTRKKR